MWFIDSYLGSRVVINGGFSFYERKKDGYWVITVHMQGLIWPMVRIRLWLQDKKKKRDFWSMLLWSKSGRVRGEWEVIGYD